MKANNYDYRGEIKGVLFEYALHKLNNRNHALYKEAVDNGFKGTTQDFMLEQESKFMKNVNPSIAKHKMFKEHDLIFIHAHAITDKKIRELDIAGADYREHIDSMRSGISFERKEILRARSLEPDISTQDDEIDEIDELIRELEE